MTVFQSFLLGLLQGLTEFLPISSSGHLVVVQHLLGFQEPMLAFDVAVHVGTLAAVVVYYRRSLRDLTVGIFMARERSREHRRLLGWLVLGTLPAVIIAVLFRDPIERLFASPQMVGIFWIVTGILLLAAAGCRHADRSLRKLGFIDTIVIGIAQGLAILPGISRSGATISAGIMRGVSAPDAANFSFLLSIPAILGATILQVRSLAGLEASAVPVYLVGAVTAAVSGYAAIAVLLRLLKRRVIRPFGWYCVAAGIVTLTVLTVL